jgi:hypothetical protein
MVLGNEYLKPLAAGYSFLHVRRLELLDNSNMEQANPSFPSHSAMLISCDNLAAEARNYCCTS